ncbi:MAG TPA: hypothetical protein VJN69_14750 [Candidatus Acidoferrales bacterium]|nr:hypothetical protein [Candidatus Acidoferrales bacterium]
MKNRAAFLALIPALSFLVVSPATTAFEYPLSPTAIRSAYLSGHATDGRNARLFDKYVRDFAAPESGPYVARIGLETPFEQVAKVAATAANIHAQEAEQEFAGKQLPFRVSVEVQFTPTYPAFDVAAPTGAYSLLQPLPDYQRDFQIDVSQGNAIEPESSRAYISSSYFSNTVWGIRGFVIEQEYDPTKIDSSDLTVEVHTPDGQDVAATFNMAELQ